MRCRFPILPVVSLVACLTIPYSIAPVLAVPTRQVMSSPISAADNSTRLLTDVLKELKERFHVDILYGDRVVRGITISSSSLNLNASLEENLKLALKDTGLQFRKVKHGAYLITGQNQDKKQASSARNQLDGTSTSSLGLVTPTEMNANTLTLSSAAAQPAQVAADQVIKGRVTGEDNEGLPGVNVVLKGTTRGTATDAEGRYQLTIPETGNQTLVFSLVGYIAQEIVVGSRLNLDVQLAPDTKTLSEVVVVGYGTQKKVNLTGAVSSVDFDNDRIASRSSSNVSTLLAGAAPGVQIQQANGLPRNNNAANITIRGVGSLNTSSAPLIVIDGQVADINSVNPNDVATISVLKDAASAAIYGSRASNGVILITTKTGKDSKGKVTFDYNNYIGTKTPTQVPDLLSTTADHMTLINAEQTNSGFAASFTQAQIDEWREKSKTDPIGYPNTNWWDWVIKKNTVMNHALSARGGNDRINFYTSVNYFKDDGMIAKSGFQRLNFRNNLSYQLNKWIKLGNNITLISTKAEPTDIDDVFQWFRATSPGQLPKHPDGRYGAPQTGVETGTNNPVMSAETQRGELTSTRIQGKIFGEFTPLPGLTVTSSYFVDVNQNYNWSGSQPTNLWNFQTNQIAVLRDGNPISLANSYGKTNSQILDVYADYKRSFGLHNLGVLGGYNQQSFINQAFNGTRQGLLSWDTPVLDAASGTITALAGNNQDYSIRSLFGRLTYNFNERYLFEANLRYDGSSRFSPEKRWGVFPSLSAGWVLSEEPFWAPLRNVAGLVKLRASWGQLGNNGIGNYEWLNFYSAANYVLNETAVAGLAYSAFGNPDITWETTNVLNIGADITLFNNLTLDLNYYNKLTNNILTNLPISAVNGGITAPRVNSAKVQNSGAEVDLRYRKNIGKLGISVGINAGYNKNKIVSYKGSLIESRGTGIAWTEGKPINTYWVREVDHIVQNKAEVDALVAQGYTFSPSTPGAGDFLYRDANGDKKINDDDRVLKGNPIPLVNYGGNISLNYAGIDFSVFANGVSGYDKYLSSATYSLNHLAGGYLYPTEYLNMWTESNRNTNIPKIYSNNEKNNQVSDYFLRNAAYFKIRSIQLGYTIPVKASKWVGLDRVRVFANLENYFTITKWPTVDPEATRSTNDDATYPLAKTMSFGLNVKF